MDQMRQNRYLYEIHLLVVLFGILYYRLYTNYFEYVLSKSIFIDSISYYVFTIQNYVLLMVVVLYVQQAAT